MSCFHQTNSTLSPLRHIESPGDTSDVNVQQEKFEVLDNAFCEGKRGNVISSLMYSVLLHAKNLGGSDWGKNSFLKYLFIHTQFKLWWSTHECCNMLQRLRHISPITSITRRRIRICVDDPSKRITIIAPVWNECIFDLPKSSDDVEEEEDNLFKRVGVNQSSS